MFFYLVFFVIIAACAVKIAIIVASKFRNLTIIDTAAIPAERDAQRKKELMQERLSRKTDEWGKYIAGKLGERFDTVREKFRAQYRRVLDLERQMRKEHLTTPAQRRERAAMLVVAANALQKEGKTGEAEQKLIEAAALTPRGAEPYRVLGALYLETRRYDRAKETLAYLAKMLVKENRCIHGAGKRSFVAEENPRACPASNAAHADLAGRFLDLASACEAVDDRQGATDAYERAVAVEPANPRHLDLLLDACILVGDRKRAEEVFLQLEKVNPENMKLPAFAERLAALPVKKEEKKQKKTMRS